MTLVWLYFLHGLDYSQSGFDAVFGIPWRYFEIDGSAGRGAYLGDLLEAVAEGLRAAEKIK